jgi:hypothetical protein
MEYVILRDEETGEIEKIGRFKENGLTESYRGGEWLDDRILYSELFDGLLENISEAEAAKIIAQQFEHEKIAA